MYLTKANRVVYNLTIKFFLVILHEEYVLMKNNSRTVICFRVFLLYFKGGGSDSIYMGSLILWNLLEQ